MTIFEGYFGLVILIECYRIPFILSSSQTCNLWLLYTTLIIISRSRHMQYLFYLNILHKQIQLLCEELKRIEEYSKYNRTKLSSSSKLEYNQFLCHRLIMARENYTIIFEISDNINDAFGWSHLTNLTHSFIQILTDFYWSHWNIDNNTNILFGGNI